MKVLVLGGGYAGVTATRRLERILPAGVELLLVDQSDRHLLQHELHRIVRKPAKVDAITVPFDSLFSRVRVVNGRVVGMDSDEQTVTLATDEEIRFDFALISLGARTAYYGLPGVEENSTPLKKVADAQTIRADFLELVDGGTGRAVVGGAGLSGVQVAGELAALADERGVGESVSVVLLEQADTVAPGFPEHFQRAVRQALVEGGIEVRTGHTVTAATADEIETERDTLSYDQFVWTGGIRGPDPMGDERPTVPATLRRDDRVFVAGDSAQVVDRDGNVLPATAQAAVAEGRVAARNLDRLVRHARNGGIFEPRLETIDFATRGWIVSVGDRTVAQVGPLVVRNAAARALKTAVGASYLTGVGAVSEAAGLVGDELTPQRNRSSRLVPRSR